VEHCAEDALEEVHPIRQKVEERFSIDLERFARFDDPGGLGEGRSREGLANPDGGAGSIAPESRRTIEAGAPAENKVSVSTSPISRARAATS
jgi:hypothetical protein